MAGPHLAEPPGKFRPAPPAAPLNALRRPRAVDAAPLPSARGAASGLSASAGGAELGEAAGSHAPGSLPAASLTAPAAHAPGFVRRLPPQQNPRGGRGLGRLRLEDETGLAWAQEHARKFLDQVKASLAEDSDGRQRLVQELQAQVAALQRQVDDLISRGGPSLTLTAVQQQQSQADLVKMLAKQREELLKLSAFVHSEFEGARKMALVPLWKQRALHDIAEVELRPICANEVAKLFKDFAASFRENGMDAAVEQLHAKGFARLDHLQDDLFDVREDLTQQVREVQLKTDSIVEDLDFQRDEFAKQHIKLMTISDKTASLGKDVEAQREMISSVTNASSSKQEFAAFRNDLATQLESEFAQQISSLADRMNTEFVRQLTQLGDRVDALTASLDGERDQTLAAQVARIETLERSQNLMAAELRTLSHERLPELRLRSLDVEERLEEAESRLEQLCDRPAPRRQIASRDDESFQEELAELVAGGVCDQAFSVDGEEKACASSAETPAHHASLLCDHEDVAELLVGDVCVRAVSPESGAQ